MKRYYPAVIDRERGSYGIVFPDFPGCVSAGASPEEAIEAGAEALSLHVAGMVADGEALPIPISLESIPKSEPDEVVVAVTLIPIIVPSRARRLNITLDESLIEEIDAVAPNRSGFLADAARSELARRRDVRRALENDFGRDFAEPKTRHE